MSRLEKLSAMLKESPDDPFLPFARAMELVKLGRSEDALIDFDRSIELSPGDPAAYHQKASTLIALRRFGEAREVLTNGSRVAADRGDRHAEGELQALLDSLGG
jgi:predicted Zn-dependent protease